MDFVLRSGADPNARVKMDDWLGDTPMLMTCHLKKDKKQEMPNENLDTVELLNKKFTLIKPDFKEMLQQSMELLVKYKACPFIANAHGMTPIFKAASKLNQSLVQLMCTEATPSPGADINIQDENEQTALTVALDAVIGLINSKKAVDTSVIKALLLNKANPNIVCEDKDTVFIKAIKTSHVPLVKVFLDHAAFALDHNCQNKSKLIVYKEGEPTVTNRENRSRNCLEHCLQAQQQGYLVCLLGTPEAKSWPRQTHNQCL